MKARPVRFSFGPGKRSEAQALADHIAASIASQPGCGGVTVYGDDSDGQYGIFVLWDSQASADAAAEVGAQRVFGCDALFERGYVTVADDWTLLTSTRESGGAYVSDRLLRPQGRVFPHQDDGRIPYFAWHRANTFQP